MCYKQYCIYLLVLLTSVDLSAPIDVYSDWVDAADAVGRGAGGGGGAADPEDEYEDEGVEA